MTADPIRVVLFQVRRKEEKLARLIETVSAHFERKEHFWIAAEDEKAVQYIDALLWASPPTSFLPHEVSEKETSALVVITCGKKNVNGARFAFNLCPTPLMAGGQVRLVYDFEDLSAPAKQQLSAHRFDAYKKGGYSVEARL